MELSVRLVVLLVAGAIYSVDSSQDVMKQLTINFGKALDSCRKEVSKFWNCVKFNLNPKMTRDHVLCQNLDLFFVIFCLFIQLCDKSSPRYLYCVII